MRTEQKVCSFYSSSLSLLDDRLPSPSQQEEEEESEPDEDFERQKEIADKSRRRRVVQISQRSEVNSRSALRSREDSLVSDLGSKDDQTG